MKIKILNNGVRVGTPETEGNFLTQASDVDIQNRIITDKVFLAVNDTPENWMEITAEDAKVIKEEQELLAEQEQQNIDNIN